MSARGPRVRFTEQDLARAVARLYFREAHGITSVPPSPMRAALQRAGYLLNTRHGVWRLSPSALDVALARGMNAQARNESP